MFKKTLLVSMMGFVAGSAMAAACDFTMDGTDKMTYEKDGKVVKEIVIPASCKDFTINLVHSGKMPITAMGHNVVIAKKSDVNGVSTDGIKAGAKAGYVKAGDKRVIAHSKMIGGGEKTSVSFPVAKVKAGGYEFFCSFPAHHNKMKGELVVK